MELDSVRDAAEESLLDLANNLDVSTALNENDIAEWMNDDDNNELSEGDINENNDYSGGFNAIKTAILYLERQEDTSPGDILVLRRLQNTAAKKKQTLTSHKYITDFFK
ncbi:hypothetical protein QE152_g24248 [Popillia japonica]|uniref:Uncharacterized protein n=1 Tax=Popillia japonica TaxID=7064 RepID=A0AAW1KH53_POPJA